MSVTPPEYGGCSWPVDPFCLGDRWTEMDEGLQERALALASSTLRRLTAYRVGGCPVTVRPCVTGGCWGSQVFLGEQTWMQPHIESGQWVNSCGRGDGCGSGCEIRLPAPIGRIDEVRVDGQVLFTTDLQVVNGNILVWRGNGDCPFPKTQDMSKPLTEVGTFGITYLNAYPVDSLGAQAAAFLALEFAKACKPKGKCDLPRGVTSVVRNGVSFEIEAGLFPNGRTGIDVVDAYIAMWNPESRIMPSKVWIPGGNGMRRV